MTDPQPAAASPPSDAPPAPAEGTFDTVTIVSVSVAHLVHDSYPAFVGVLLPLLIPKLGIGLAVAGLLASTFRWATAVQPVLGYVADRVDTRYWIVLAPAVTGLAIGVLGQAPSPGLVALLLVVAGLSSSFFHPAAGALITRAAGTSWGRGTSYFMTGGESGRAIGPVVIAAILAAVGLGWSWVAIAPGLLLSLILFRRILNRPVLQLRHPTGSFRAAISEARRGFVLMSGVNAALGMATIGLAIFIPTYLTERGAGILLAGAAVTVYEIGGAVGAFIGGTLSDRIGRRAMLGIGVGAGSPLMLLALAMPVGPAMLAVLAVAGLALLSSGPVRLVLMQELLPHHRAMAVGMQVFVVTLASAVGTVVVGLLAQLIGLQESLVLAAAVALLALPFIALLPETRHVSRGQARAG